MFRRASLALLLALSSSPARAQFFDEHVLPGDLTVAPAAGDQRNAALARGSNQSLMVWEDFRPTLGGTVAVSSTGGAVLCAARLDAAGALIDTSPIVVRSGTSSPREPKVAWNGTQYLVVWDEYVPHPFESDRGVFAARVDVNGRVLDNPPLLLKDVAYVDEYSPAVTSDGTSWAVVWGDLIGNVDAIAGCFVDANGGVGPLKTLMTSTSGYYYPRNFEIAWANGRYLFVSEHFPIGGSFNDALGQLFDATLAKIGGEIDLGFGSNFGTNCSVAGNGSGFAVAWNSAIGNIRATPVSTTGVVAVPGGLDVSGALYIAYQLPSISWDGQNWMIAFGSSSGTNGAMNVARMSPSGQQLGASQTVAQGNWTLERPAVAATQSGSQVVWTDARGAQSVFTSDRLDLFSVTLDASGVASSDLDLSQSPPAQTDSDIAGSAASGYLVVFLSQTQTTATVAAQRVDAAGVALDPQPLAISVGPRTKRNPAVAWNGSNWLVVWEEAVTGGSNVLGVRISAAGARLDATPIAIMPGSGPDVAAVGNEYLVVASHEPINHSRYIYTERVRGSDGALLDAAPIQRTVSYDTQPTVAAFNDRWIVAWAHTVTHDASYATIRYMIVFQNGTASLADVGGDGGFTNNEPTLAIDGTQALLSWSSGGDIRARRILPTPAKLDTDAGVVVSSATNKQFAPAVGWNGVDFFVAYADYRRHVNPLETGIGDTYGCRVTTSGSVLDPNGQALAAAARTPEGQPAVAGSAGRSLISLSTLRTDAPYGTWRITLEAAAPAIGTYCSAKVNSLGCTPVIGWSGTPSASAGSGFTITGSNVRSSTSGMLLYGFDGPLALPFHGGTLCVKTPVYRTPVRNSGGIVGLNCTGVFALDFNAFAAGSAGGSPHPLLLQPGTAVHCQWWGRDSGFSAPDNIALTEGLRFSM